MQYYIFLAHEFEILWFITEQGKHISQTQTSSSFVNKKSQWKYEEANPIALLAKRAVKGQIKARQS